jgi:ElaB/YqjD/DUF883 family membrane-anchored ribosome-binding protein
MAAKKSPDWKVKVTAAKKKAKVHFQKAKAKLVKAEKDVERYIEKNPKKSAAIAAGVGAALGAAIAAALMRAKKK